MRFGVNILNFTSGTTPDTLLRWARYAEERGFHSAMISDHVAITPDVAQVYPAPFYDPFTTLAWLAGQTRRVELGTTVAILPYRHPLHTARVTANIDRFSGGRLILGVGVSWPRQEYAALGVPFHRRGAITDEYLEVITRAWREEEFSFAGEFVSFERAATGPLPVRVPPVWVGGASPAALRRAVRYGDAWHPLNQRMADLREGLAALRRAAAEAGRERPPAFAPRLPLLVTDGPIDGEDRLVGQGTLDQIRRDLDELAELGAEHVLFDTYPGSPDRFRPVEEDLAMLDRVVEQVLPRVA
ncbi:TIGR03619 family F420-dependent LLM class oxidoreductase [Streptomonospora nanhaiensis]|uniref:TIGR03619 family F420-dependent LLM class oxidoreductase n=1 Tax=Streptomonospora nanhaiensis TaxID=1323731 RepID=UPI001C393A70|nr:TIGR03619 family F420-dependent LLM class oxidoreductase [Streptomonospora nanhaiensis]MBV2365203.1 TIGR03619 family F420-dependent LLM class oxidoreductase [Streptomonospora nanhaiensis]MBX9387416.1 TIGR03619 family F420-dependent LLM class oxidoreductase [Streptomonospora nanhaiensis]